MLKTRVNGHIWLVPQHQHAQVSGYLAAHWGNASGFARPGYYAPASAPQQVRAEVILGVAEHDNGWWEEEAMPRFADDGLPVGLGEAAAPSPDNGFDQWRAGGFDRWRLGIDRVAGPHPYAALLTSYHAYWLYAVAFDDLMSDGGDAFRHSLFGDPQTAAGLVGEVDRTRDFLDDMRRIQIELCDRLARDAELADALRPQHLYPHVRLLQLLDTLSLLAALNEQGGGTLRDVPRASWEDRVAVRWRRSAGRRFVLDPYPFDLDPLPVLMPMRMVEAVADTLVDEAPLARLHAAAPTTVSFVFASSD